MFVDGWVEGRKINGNVDIHRDGRVEVLTDGYVDIRRDSWVGG